MDFESVKDTGI